MKVFISGAWREVKDGRIYIAGAWRRISRKMIFLGGSWRTAATFTPPLSATASGANYVIRGANGASNGYASSTAFPSGGAAPYSYSRVITPTVGPMPIVESPTFATVGLRMTVSPGDNFRGNIVVTVKDVSGQTAVATSPYSFISRLANDTGNNL